MPRILKRLLKLKQRKKKRNNSKHKNAAGDIILIPDSIFFIFSHPVYPSRLLLISLLPPWSLLPTDWHTPEVSSHFYDFLQCSNPTDHILSLLHSQPCGPVHFQTHDLQMTSTDAHPHTLRQSYSQNSSPATPGSAHHVFPYIKHASYSDVSHNILLQ